MDNGEQRLPKLTLEAQEHRLSATFTPGAGVVPPTQEQVQQLLQQQGYGNWHVEQKALQAFINSCRQATHAISADIGEQRDAEFIFNISSDKLSLYLTLLPAEGGEPIGDKVEQALMQQGILHGILRSELDAALAKGQCENVLIAQGDPVQPSREASFVSLLDNIRNRKRHSDADKVVDFRDLGNLLIVQPGDALMRRIPAQPGKNGIDIFGQSILAEAVQDTPFPASIKGAQPADDDPDLLLASSTGQPVQHDNCVVVNPVIEVANVDLDSGNITFEGTVRVLGDVKAGMHLIVTGDVLVEGTVESAEVVAGGDVSVRGGVIGHAEVVAGSLERPDAASRIRCGGSLQALFLENTHVEASKSILVENSVRQCDLTAGHTIQVGKAGSKLGHIIGGRCRATHTIHAGSIGTSAGTATRILVGFDPYLHSALLAKEKTIKAKQAELHQLEQLLTFLAQNPHKDKGGIGSKAEHTREKLLQDLADTQQAQQNLAERLNLASHARVISEKAIYSGTDIHIGNTVWHVREDAGAMTLMLADDKIVLE